LARISHDSTEALATIEEQHIDLLLADFETLHQTRNYRLATCDALCIKGLMMICNLKQSLDSKCLIISRQGIQFTDIAAATSEFGIRNENNNKKKDSSCLIMESIQILF
jgi:hypothetical protein